MSEQAAPNLLMQRLHENRGILFPISCIGLLLVLLVPLPTQVLDFLLILNLTLSVIVLVTTMYVKTPLEFAVFPSLLLAVTLFRLVLNVATTRLILTANRPGIDPIHAGGDVVLAFSNFVSSNELVVGAVIFLIIFVIQFVVITKGCARISEVAARFILDAMPGKQMAIDADVTAGTLTEAEARKRREEISQQADFYGAMDGASKFVRGDAIAGILITVINILGGLYVGMIKMNKGPQDAMELFTRLTIGDGLVSQIPAFIVSLAAGLIVTRSSDRTELGEQVIGQILAKPKALIVAAAFLMLLSIAGLPKIPLFIMAGGCAFIAYMLNRNATREAAAEIENHSSASTTPQPEAVEKFLDLDTLELEIGPGLLKLADTKQGGDLLDRIRDIRKQIAQELGLIVPAVRIHDNAELSANDYIIKIRGHAFACGVTYPEQYLAIAPIDASRLPDAESTADPITQAPAYWITESQLSHAASLHYDIIEAPEVLTTHLAETIRCHAHELLTRQEVKNLLDNLKQRSPALVDDVVPSQLKPGELHRVLQNLLRERVSIRDLETILETLADHATTTTNLDTLTEHVRQALSRTICRQYVDDQNRLACLTLDPEFENELAQQSSLAPDDAERLLNQLQSASDQLSQSHHAPVILCSPPIRAAVRRLIEVTLPRVAVLSFKELSPDVSIEALGSIAAHQSRGLEPAVQPG
jgi:flagellar biosynthesis protein FlhA